MQYPEVIVSHAAYKEKIPIDDLKPEDFCVTRRIDGKVSDNSESFNGHAVLDPDCMGNIIGMSVNILGGLFLPEHTLWIQDGKGKKPWDGVEDVNVDDYPGCYRLHDGEFVYYRVSQLHNANYPHEYKLENKDQYKAYHNAIGKKIEKAFKPGEKTDISVTLTLESAPSFLNYWHFEVITSLTGTSVRLRNNDSYRRMVYSHILNHVLCRDFLQENATPGSIPADIYTK